jgi:hypothetical protein
LAMSVLSCGWDGMALIGDGVGWDGINNLAPGSRDVPVHMDLACPGQRVGNALVLFDCFLNRLLEDAELDALRERI